jgi:hypothetical protein
MTTSQLLQELSYRGITLTKVGDKLRCKVGGVPLPPDLRDQIQEHRAELLATLVDTDGGESLLQRTLEKEPKTPAEEAPPKTNNSSQIRTINPINPINSPDQRPDGSRNGHSPSLVATLPIGEPAPPALDPQQSPLQRTLKKLMFHPTSSSPTSRTMRPLKT